MPHKFKKIVLLETLSNESFDKYKNIQSWKQNSKRKKKVFYVTKCLLTYLLTNFQVKKWKYGSLLRMQHFISSVDKKKHKLNYAISF